MRHRPFLEGMIHGAALAVIWALTFAAIVAVTVYLEDIDAVKMEAFQ